MSEIRVNTIVSENGTGNVAFNKGINVTGVTTATTFSGSGASLTNLPAANITGTLGAISGANLTDLSGTAIASGTVAAARVATLNQNTSGTAGGLSGTPDITVQNITGVAATFTGVLTYEDVTNVDSVGIVTARGGLEVGAAGVGGTVSALGHVEFVGVTTIGLGLTLADNIQARFGNAGDIKIYHDASNSYIQNETNNLFLKGDAVNIRTLANQQVIETASGGSVELFEAGSKKLETSATGVTITGDATATSFIGVSTGGTASGATVGVGTTATIIGVTDGATQNRFSGILVEQASIQATNVTSGSIDLAQGNVHYFSTNGSGASTAAIKYKGGNNLSGYMKVGENISISIISKPNNSEYINAVTVDGSAVTEEWVGGTPSSASGAASTVTITTINLTRIASTGTPNSDYLVLCSATNYE